MTLVELLIAIGLTSILGLAIISGSLFIQRFVSAKLNQMALTEELSFLSESLSSEIETAERLFIYDDSLVCYSKLNQRHSLTWHDHIYRRNGHQLSHSGFHLKSIEIKRLSPRDNPNAQNINELGPPEVIGKYKVKVAVRDKKQNEDSIMIDVRNNYEYQKYQF